VLADLKQSLCCCPQCSYQGHCQNLWLFSTVQLRRALVRVVVLTRPALSPAIAGVRKLAYPTFCSVLYGHVRELLEGRDVKMIILLVDAQPTPACIIHARLV
jgi:hypothetical protein